MKKAIVLISVLLTLAGMAVSSQAAGAKRYVITDYAAVGDGQTLNTDKIQSAIDQCAAKGGGVVVVPQGIFLTGAIFLKPHVSLEVDKGGTLKGTANPADYPQIQTRWEGVERLWTSALVNAVDMTGATITGEGTIDGSGDEWVRRSPPRRRAPLGSADGTPPAAAPITGTAPAVGAIPTADAMPQPQRLGRPRLICFQNCHGVHIAGLTLHNQAIWCLHLLYSDNVVAENLTIRADHNIPSSDGIDVDSCRHVRIAKCDIDDNDDCISIKSGKDADGLRVHRPSEDILVENCRFGYGQGGVAMGSETSGGIRNVTVRNCVFEDGNWAPLRFKSQPSRGGVVENITYRDIQLHNTRQAVEINLQWRMVPPLAPPSNPLPMMRNITFLNISGTVLSGGAIHGLPGSPITGVKFQNVKITAQRGLTLSYTKDVDLSGLTLTVPQGPSIIRQDTASAAQNGK